jgi:hypothetical protein
MTSEEFSLHLAYWDIEPTGPAGEMLRWSGLMAALHNGPMVKRNKQPFKAAEFWPADQVWQLPAEPVPPKPGEKPKRMAPDFSHLRGMKVRKARPPKG